MTEKSGGAFADLWEAGARAFWSAQQKMLEETLKVAAAMPGADPVRLPGMSPEIEAWATATQAFNGLWSSAMEVSAAIAKTLGMRQAPDATISATLARMFEPQHWLAGTDEMGQTLQRLAEGPRLADLWNDERRLMAISSAWLGMRRANLEHNAVMLDAWCRAGASFASRADERARAGEPLQSWRDTVVLWTETANQVLLETQRGSAYLEAQQKLVRASTDLRLAQRAAAEHYGEIFGLPTRSEIDELHRTVTQLRRELRALQRERAPAPSRPPIREPPHAEGHVASGQNGGGARRGRRARPQDGARGKAVQRDP